MKESKITSRPPLFSSMRRRLLRSPEGDLWIDLPERWCLRLGLGHLAEIEMWEFPDVLLMFPPSKHPKPSQIKSRLVSAVTMLELTKKLGDVVEQMRQAVKKNKRSRTRHKRES